MARKKGKDTMFATTTLSRQVPLTDHDRIEMGNELATKELEYSEVSDEKKKIAGGFQERLDGIESRIKHLSRVLTEGGELRDIEVRIVPDLETKMVRYLRLESDDLVEERAMTQDELQGDLFLGDPEDLADGEVQGAEA